MHIINLIFCSSVSIGIFEKKLTVPPAPMPIVNWLFGMRFPLFSPEMKRRSELADRSYAFFALNAECETVCGVYLNSKSPAGFRIASALPIPVISVLAQLLDFSKILLTWCAPVLVLP